MLFDTRPGDEPLPVTTHSLEGCPCGHPADAHEAMETEAGDERTDLIVCLECDVDEV